MQRERLELKLVRLGDVVDDGEANVMARVLVRRTWVPQTKHQKNIILRIFPKRRGRNEQDR